jgi:hypothetical protein
LASARSPFFESADPGLALQASLGHPVGSHLSARLDASLNRISAAHHFGACTPGGFCYPSFSASLGVVGVGASGLVGLDFTPGMYLIAGAGTSYFYENPLTQGALRLNLSLGAGLAVPTAPGWPQVVVEARYVRLIDAPSAPTWVLPLTVGLRF